MPILVRCAISLLAATGLGACASPRGDTPEARRAWTDQMADQALAALFEDDHAEEKMDAEGVAWGVFEVVGVNAFVLSTTGGYGVIIDRETDERTYVTIRGGGPGLGIGFTRARSVYLLRSREAADAFIAGVISWNAEGELVALPAGRGFAIDSVGTARGQTEVFHDIEHGLSIGASLKALRIEPE